jgi:hypothetical protein
MPIGDTLSLWLSLQDKRQVDGVARCVCDIPIYTETPGCPMRVTIFIIIGTHVVVAVLDGQDVGSTTGLDMGGEKINLTDIPLAIVRDRGALPPPLRFVVAPHLQEGSCHPHTCSRGGEH